jgi:selenocysteine lyase/cysteine desulfurase
MDFAATASYKWLQGDFGLGFLYVKKSVLAGLRRPVMSYRQVQHYATHLFPDDTAGKAEISYEQSNTTAGYFEQGTLANGISETLAYSLNYLQTIGVAKVSEIHSISDRTTAGRGSKTWPRVGYAGRCSRPAGDISAKTPSQLGQGFGQQGWMSL